MALVFLAKYLTSLKIFTTDQHSSLLCHNSSDHKTLYNNATYASFLKLALT